MMLRRELTYRIGGSGITSEQKCLAAAAAEVDLATIAASTWLGHPRRSSEALEDRCTGPDLRKRGVAHVGKFQSSNLAGALAGEHRAVGSDRQEYPPPAVEAGLGELLKVIRQDMQDLGTLAEPPARPFHNVCRILDLLAARQQRTAIAERPARILHVGQFQPIDVPGNCQIHNLFDLLEVVAMDDDIECHGKIESPCRRDRAALLFK